MRVQPVNVCTCIKCKSGQAGTYYYPGWKGTRLRGNPRDYGGITRILRLFSRVKRRKYRQNTHDHQVLTAIRCVNECN